MFSNKRRMTLPKLHPNNYANKSQQIQNPVNKPAKHLPIPELPRAMKCRYPIPQNIKYTSDIKYNDITQCRDRLRRNKIEHKNFEPKYECNEGNSYFYKLYRKNQETYEDPATDAANAADAIGQFFVDKPVHE